MKRIVAILIIALLAGSASAFAGEVGVVDKDQLKEMLDSKDLVVFDVRTGRDWSSSEFKIKGAVRLEGSGIDSAVKKYSKEKTIVFYCA